MGNYKDISGQKFGSLTAIRKVENKRSTWLCKCDCGGYREVMSYKLKNGKIKECKEYHNHGRTKNGNKYLNLTCKTFGRLTAKEIVGKNKRSTLIWKCICSCGKEKNVMSSLLTSGKVKSCGCLHKEGAPDRLRAYVEKNPRRGKDSPHWRGGLTDRNKIIRHSKEYKEWRVSVFERDNYCCAICGNKGSIKINAHHIVSFSQVKDSDYLFNINNGVTMCKKCHVKFHNKYGHGNNNGEQFIDFISKEIIMEVV